MNTTLLSRGTTTYSEFFRQVVNTLLTELDRLNTRRGIFILAVTDWPDTTRRRAAIGRVSTWNLVRHRAELTPVVKCILKIIADAGHEHIGVVYVAWK